VLGGICPLGRPELKCLRYDGEPFAEWSVITPEKLLLRWLAFHLKTADPIEELEVVLTSIHSHF
jgi:hypothetical protein